MRLTLVFKTLTKINVWAAKLSDKPDNFSVRTISTSEHHLRTLKKFQGIYIQFESKVTVKLSINIAIGTQYVRM